MRQHISVVNRLALILAMSVFGAAPVSLASGLKIGYVNVIKVIEEAPQGVAALRKLETEFGPRDQELVSLQNKIRKIEEGMQKDVSQLRESERREREREIFTLKRELKRATQEFREDYNLRRNEELSVLQRAVRGAIIDIAKKEKFDLILEEGVVYAGDTVDITDKVLRKLGKQ